MLVHVNLYRLNRSQSRYFNSNFYCYASIIQSHQKDMLRYLFVAQIYHNLMSEIVSFTDTYTMYKLIMSLTHFLALGDGFVVPCN